MVSYKRGITWVSVMGMLETVEVCEKRTLYFKKKSTGVKWHTANPAQWVSCCLKGVCI